MIGKKLVDCHRTPAPVVSGSASTLRRRDLEPPAHEAANILKKKNIKADGTVVRVLEGGRTA